MGMDNHAMSSFWHESQVPWQVYDGSLQSCHDDDDDHHVLKIFLILIDLKRKFLYYNKDMHHG